MKSKLYTFSIIALTAAVIAACSSSENKPSLNDKIVFENKSVNPALAFAMPGFETKLQINTLISSDDQLVQSPSFVFGAQPDGAGLMKDPAGTGYIMINNHEIHRAVSRVYLDETLKAVKGEYILDFEGGQWRTCSATLATPEEHGFGPIFLTAGESGEESLIHAIDPVGAADKKNKTRVKPALGKASMENAVPLTKNAYPGKTVIMIGEDQSFGSSHQSAGQFILYVSNIVGDLENGKLYVLKRTNDDVVETNIKLNQEVDVAFVEIPNAKNLKGSEINTKNIELKALRFSRVEDLDYRKGSAANNREIYFTATGQSSNGVDPTANYTMWGRIYKLVLDAADPLKGKLSLVIDGDSQPGVGIINPDNICVTENYVYTQEDGDSYYPAAKHDSYIWQYNIASKENKPWVNMNHKRDDATFNAKYNPANEKRFGSWEWGAMYDISDIIGVPNTFLANIHPHTWQADKYLNVEGSGLSTNKEAGQVIIIRGVEK
jgi:hypothetical protein